MRGGEFNQGCDLPARDDVAPMGDRRNHIGNALIGVGGACWIGALIADGSKAMVWLGLPSALLYVAGAACIAGAVLALRSSDGGAQDPGMAPELEAESRQRGTDRAVVTTEHRDELREMLEAAQRAVENGVARGDGDHLTHEMFEAHFGDLESSLREWDETIGADASAFGTLKEAIAQKLRERGADNGPYVPAQIAEGLAVITARRALADRLGDPLPPAFSESGSVWRAFGSDHVMAGVVDFNPYSVNATGNVLVFERNDYPAGEFIPRVQQLLVPLYGVLTDAQAWDEARAVPLAKAALSIFPKDALVDDLRKAQLKPSISTVPGCHGCD